jgi:ribonuclease HII
MLLDRFKDDTIIEIGIDEAGRGSFWGPLTAGAIIIPFKSCWTDKQTKLFDLLRDSKKIPPKKRETLFEQLKELVPQNGIGMVSSDEINEKGITWANQEAFRRAINSIPNIDPSECRIIIDGVLPISDWKGSEGQETVVDGDATYLAIAAASIIAKVEHDRWIKDYCEKNPQCDIRYDLTKSKGYGTANHREGIRVYGGHELHRLLYIENWLPSAPERTVKQRKKRTSTKDIVEEKCLIKF